MNKNIQLTIVTPTYNRAKMLPNLYRSLCEQTSKNFIWLIIDDGSKDNTEEVVKAYKKEKRLNIQYYYQKNSGKYVAHNTGVLMCSTELFLCVDSDDELLPHAVEIIEHTWEGIKGDTQIVGIVSPKEMDGHSYFSDPPQRGKLMDLYNSGSLVGETALVFRSCILKENLFPVITDEKFMSEDVLYNILDQRYELFVLNEFVYRAGYQDDGLTRNIQRIHWLNPKSTLLMYENNAAYQTCFTKAVKSYGSYLAWKKYRKLSSCASNCRVPIKVKFFGLLLFYHYYKLFEEQEKELNL